MTESTHHDPADPPATVTPSPQLDEEPPPSERVARLLGVVTTLAVIAIIGFVLGRSTAPEPKVESEGNTDPTSQLLSIGHYCGGGIPMETAEVRGFTKSTMTWIDGDTFSGQFTVMNATQTPQTLSTIALNWPNNGFELSLKIQPLEDDSVASGCIPLPDVPDAAFPITVQPGATEYFRYSITMGKCAEIGEFGFIGFREPLLRVIVDTPAGPVTVDAGPFDEVAFGGGPDCTSQTES